MPTLTRVILPGQILEDRNPISLTKPGYGLDYTVDGGVGAGRYNSIAFGPTYPYSTAGYGGTAPSVLSLYSITGVKIASTGKTRIRIDGVAVQGNAGPITITLGSPTTPNKSASNSSFKFALTTYGNRREGPNSLGNIGPVSFKLRGNGNTSNLSILASAKESAAPGRTSTFTGGPGGSIGAVLIQASGNQNKTTVDRITAENKGRGSIASAQIDQSGAQSELLVKELAAGTDIGNITITNAGDTLNLSLKGVRAGGKIGNINLVNYGDDNILSAGDNAQANFGYLMTPPTLNEETNAPTYNEDTSPFVLGQDAIFATSGVGNISSQLGLLATGLQAGGENALSEFFIRNGLFGQADGYGIYWGRPELKPLPDGWSAFSELEKPLPLYYQLPYQQAPSSNSPRATGNIGNVILKTIGARGTTEAGFRNFGRAENAAYSDQNNDNRVDALNGNIGAIAIETNACTGTGQTQLVATADGSISSVQVTAISARATADPTDSTTPVKPITTSADLTAIRGSLGRVAVSSSGIADNSQLSVNGYINGNIGNITTTLSGEMYAEIVNAYPESDTTVSLTSFLGDIGNIQHSQDLAKSNNAATYYYLNASAGSIGTIAASIKGNDSTDSSLELNLNAGRKIGATRISNTEAGFSTGGNISLYYEAASIDPISTENNSFNGETTIALIASESIGAISSKIGKGGQSNDPNPPGPASVYYLSIDSASRTEYTGPLTSGYYPNGFKDELVSTTGEALQNNNLFSPFDPDGLSSINTGPITVAFDSTNNGIGQIHINTTQFWKSEDLGYFPEFLDFAGYDGTEALYPATLGSDIGTIRVSGGAIDAYFELGGDATPELQLPWDIFAADASSAFWNYGNEVLYADTYNNQAYKDFLATGSQAGPDSFDFATQNPVGSFDVDFWLDAAHYDTWRQFVDSQGQENGASFVFDGDYGLWESGASTSELGWDVTNAGWGQDLGTVWARTIDDVDFSQYNGYANISLWGVMYGGMTIASSKGGSNITSTLSSDTIILATTQAQDTINLSDIMNGPDTIINFKAGNSTDADSNPTNDVLSLWRTYSDLTGDFDLQQVDIVRQNAHLIIKDEITGGVESDSTTGNNGANGVLNAAEFAAYADSGNTINDYDVIRLQGPGLDNAEDLYDQLTDAGSFNAFSSLAQGKYVWVATADTMTSKTVRLFKVHLNDTNATPIASLDNGGIGYEAAVQQLATLTGLNGGIASLDQANFFYAAPPI